MRCSRARSTPSASSNSASRARQTPSPYFGRSNTTAVPSQKKCDARFSGSDRRDRIASSSRIDGLELTSIISSSRPASRRYRRTDRRRRREARALARPVVASVSAASEAAHSERHRCRPRSDSSAPEFRERSPFAGTASSDGVAAREASRRKAAGAQRFVMGGQAIRGCVRTPSPATDGRIFSRAIQHLIVEQENPVFAALDDRLHQDRRRNTSRPRRDSEAARLRHEPLARNRRAIPSAA